MHHARYAVIRDAGKWRINHQGINYGYYDDAEAAWNRVLPAAEGRCLVEAMAGGRTLTLTPRRTGTDGFFIALFERLAD